MPPPTEAVTLERARSFANEAMWTVALQLRRVAEDDPADETFVFRRWADWQFLIVALRRLQRAAELAVTTATGDTFVAAPLDQFRQEIPGLTTMRNVAEHIESYAVDSPARHDKKISRTQLQVGQLSGEEFVWLGHTLKAHDVRKSAEALHAAVMDAYHSLPPARPPRKVRSGP